MDVTPKNTHSAALSPSMSLMDVKNAFAQMNVSHLPVVREGVFLGTLSYEVISKIESDFSLENYISYLDSIFVNQNTHWMDVFQLMLKHSCNCIPVVSDSGVFIRTYSLQDVMEELSATPFANHQGNTLILKAATKDFDISKLSQIIEAHGGAVLGFLTENQTEENTVIWIKFQTHDFNNTCKSLRRYGYQIESSMNQHSLHSNFSERIDYIKKYMLT